MTDQEKQNILTSAKKFFRSRFVQNHNANTKKLHIDVFDGIRKYCQIKAGPNTINKDDVPVIKDHFRALINLGRTNGVRIASADFLYNHGLLLQAERLCA